MSEVAAKNEPDHEVKVPGEKLMLVISRAIWLAGKDEDVLSEDLLNNSNDACSVL